MKGVGFRDHGDTSVTVSPVWGGVESKAEAGKRGASDAHAEVGQSGRPGERFDFGLGEGSGTSFNLRNTCVTLARLVPR